MRTFNRFLLICLLLVGLLGCQEKETPEMVQGALVGQPAPDFTLVNMQGEEVTLSQFRGKVVLVNFWATWCPPCREEMPSMDRLYRNFKDEGLVLLAINIEESGGVAVGPFMDAKSYTFPVLLDVAGVAQARYGVFRFPETFLIDRNGMIVDKVVGARDWMGKDILQKINFLLNG